LECGSLLPLSLPEACSRPGSALRGRQQGGWRKAAPRCRTPKRCAPATFSERSLGKCLDRYAAQYGVFDNIHFGIKGSDAVVLMGQASRPTLKSVRLTWSLILLVGLGLATPAMRAPEKSSPATAALHIVEPLRESKQHCDRFVCGFRALPIRDSVK
jgi:hypothetical protein